MIQDNPLNASATLAQNFLSSAHETCQTDEWLTSCADVLLRNSAICELECFLGMTSHKSLQLHLVHIL